MSKIVYYDDEARERLMKGAEALYKAVKVTMGPKGQNVIIDKSYGNPSVTHDGVTVAKAVELADDDESTLGYKVGAELIKEAASKMNDVAGDGTTTVTVLTYHILHEANKLIAAGNNPMELRKGIEMAVKQVVAEIPKLAQDITGAKQKIAEVATISANDSEIGELIADVIESVGKDGVVTVEESQGLEMEADVVEGFTMDRGYVSPYMVTDTGRMEAVYKDPAVLITDKKISSVQEFLPVLEKLAQSGKKDLVIIAEDLEGEALGTLVLNKLKGTFNALAIKAPAFGDRRKEILEDIAALTGGVVISEDRGTTFDDVDLDMLGSAKTIISGKDESTIVQGGGSKADVAARVEQINNQINAASSEYDRENLEKRRAALSGKVAVIRVGGNSETEIEEKKFRVDDAVAAVKAALAEGIVAGGGITPVNLSESIQVKGADAKAAGMATVKRALLEPFRQLMINAGKNADALLAKVQESKAGMGVVLGDEDNSDLADMVKSGVIDPAMVTRQAIQYAGSIAGTAITMGAMVVEKPKPDAPAMPDMGGGMGGMGMGM